MGEIVNFSRSSMSHRPDGSLVNFRPEKKAPPSVPLPGDGKIIDQTVFEAKRDEFRSDIYSLTSEDFPLIDIASPLRWESHE